MLNGMLVIIVRTAQVWLFKKGQASALKKTELPSTPALFNLFWFLKTDNMQELKESNILPEISIPICKIQLWNLLIQQADYITVTVFKVLQSSQ